MTQNPLTPVDLAEVVAVIARGLGIETALIGAYALAAHHYVRATADLDLGAVTSLRDLQQLKDALEARGYHAKLNYPDELDPLGGVLAIWVREDDEGDPIEPVEIVNFLNPYRPRRTPAADAIKRAIPLQGKPSLCYVGLADLIAMKLDAGGPADVVDVMRLLEKNPTADREEIRATSKRYGFDIIDTLIAEAS